MTTRCCRPCDEYERLAMREIDSATVANLEDLALMSARSGLGVLSLVAALQAKIGKEVRGGI